MCRAPLTSMEFAPDGAVLACCANFLHPIGFAGQQTLREMWTGPAAEALRDAVRRGDLSLGCTICSNRIRHDGAELPLLAYEHLDLTDGGAWPTSLSFSLHNTCNLECIMCGADRSSRIRTRRFGLPPLPHQYGDEFFDQIGEFIAHASVCDFVGGEPLLVREHWRIWDIMREVSPAMPCAVTTNGTIWNDRVERLLADFPTTVRISMDGMTAETFEAVRVGARFDTFLANFDRFQEYSRERGTDLTIAWSFVRQNWFELADALLWAEARGVWIYVTTVLERDFGVQHLPTDELIKVHEAMQEQSSRIRPYLQLNRETWDRQIQMIATELAERGALTEREACFDAPVPESAELVAARLIADAADPEPARVEAPTLASFAASWGLDLRTGRRITVELSEPAGRGSRAEAVASLAATLRQLCLSAGGELWRLEELPLLDAFVYTVAVGAPERDGEPVDVIRLVSTRPAAGSTSFEINLIETTRDAHLAVAVSIRPRP